jgi:hypothetical protein
MTIAACLPHREWSIEKALDKMMTDWEGLTFELGPWKETGDRGSSGGGGAGGYEEGLNGLPGFSGGGCAATRA